MSRTGVASCLGILTILIVGRFGDLPRSGAALAALPQSPGNEGLAEKLKESKANLPKSIRPPKPAPPDEAAPADGGLRSYMATTDQAILFYQARVAANPQDFAGYCYLGEIWRRKARETGSLESYEQAEAAFRKALALFPNFPRAESALATVLASRHKFDEALRIARKLTRENPKDLDALATLGDALMELGQYAEAEKALQKLHRLAPTMPEVLGRRAGLAELKGDAEGAKRLMQQAVKAVQKETSDPKAIAWYQGRLGDIALNAGRVDEAESFYRSVPPETDPFHDATAGLGRIRAGQGRLDEAIELYKKAIAIGPDPLMLAALGDLYVKTGRAAEARPLFEQLEKIAGARAEHRRELAKYFADQGHDPRRAVELAQLDLAERKDVYGYDTLAWALLQADRPAEAVEALKEALKLGTQDANLFYHAGMIYRRLRDKVQAREYLGKALRLNPQFSLHAEEARAALESLD